MLKEKFNYCSVSQEECAAIHKKEVIAYAQEKLDWAKKGHEEPNVYLNGCKSKAALVRLRQKELSDIENSFKNDAWSDLIDAIYAKFPIYNIFLDGFSNKRTCPEVRSLREQAEDTMISHKYSLKGDFWMKDC